jgi:YVTN family beta-propeller protein
MNVLPTRLGSSARGRARGPRGIALLACGALAFLAHCAAAGPASAPPAAIAGAVLATIPVGEGPTVLAIAPDGSHVYAAASGGQLSVISTGTDRIVATVPIGPNPTGIVVSPDGTRVFMTHLFAVDLTVVDATTNAPAKSIDLTTERFRGGFSRIALSPDGTLAYVVNYDNQVLGIVPTAGGPLDVRLMNMSPRDIALTADGRSGYIAGCWSFCTPGTVQAFDTGARRFGERLSVGPSPYRIALSPDGRTIFTTNLGDSSLSIVDLDRQRATRSVRAAVEPTGLAVSPDGATVYVVGQNDGNLARIDVASGTTRVIPIGERPREIVLSPDGHRAYVSTQNAVLVLNLAALP